MFKKPVDRRKFFKTTAAGVIGAAALPGLKVRAGSQDEAEGPTIKARRTLGRTGFKVSDIGIGASMLTQSNVLQVALDKGLNYLDTAEHYAGGRSESTIGEVLPDRDRKSLFITTKLNLSWGGEAVAEKIKERFYKSLARMKTDYADCLMIHMCTLEQVGHPEFHKAADELKAEGKVRFLGLSNHGPEQSIYGRLTDPMETVLLAAVEDGRYDVVLFVYNFLQKEQGEKIIKGCASKKMGVTLMKTNPVNVYKRWKKGIDEAEAKGRKIPEALKKVDREYVDYLKATDAFKAKYGLKSDEDIRDAAIKFCLSNPGVHSVCPTIMDFDMLDSFTRLSGQVLKVSDASLLNGYSCILGRYYCRHACGACEPACPHSVPVNTILRYNHYFEAQHREKEAMVKYDRLAGNHADLCRDCSGPCESACPHNVPVQALLTGAHENLALC